MDKILIEVFLPAANQKYDVYVPIKSKTHEVIQLMGSVFSELSHGFFTHTQDMVLYCKEKKSILDINLSIEELNLKNGSKLILI